MEKIVARIPITGGELRVLIQEFRGTSKLHIRRFFEDELHVWHPTQKGVALDLTEAIQVSDAIGLGINELRKA